MPDRGTTTPEEGAAVPPSPLVDVAPAPSEAGRRRRALAALLAVCVLALVAAVVVDRVRQGPPGSPPGSWTLVPHQGLGAWVDVYDWTDEFTGGNPPVGVDDIDAMAELGIQTLYVQTGHDRSASAVIEPDRLEELIDRAHEHDLHVVAWYLPTLEDLDRDLARLVAAAELRVDGLGVDIESVELPDPAVRTDRILELTTRLRAQLGPDKALAAITLTAVHLEVVNPEYWPGYPWAELGERYDAILPMTYWSLRRDDLRSGVRYVGENITRIRALTGRPDLPIHPIGGIADAVTAEDLTGMLQAIEAGDAIGGSLYDWATSTPAQWDVLAPLRDLRPG
jgi:hypothetical protein